MICIEKRSELTAILKSEYRSPRGFVPTMGALHRGHLELVRRAVNENEVVVVSIFVNPAQFNSSSDLEKYPRTPGADIEILSQVLREHDIVFMPTIEDIYPSGTAEQNPEKAYDFGSLDKSMEGVSRPGHFSGVARVVSILFEITEPDVAYFGKKDFQQLAVIREMSRQAWPRIKIVGCPTVREENGLAMSSRNERLTSEARQRAGVIYKTMNDTIKTVFAEGVEAARSRFTETVGAAGFETVYYEVVDERYLIPRSGIISSPPEGVNHYICVAVIIEGVRLIDNIRITLQ